jgi:hypothetical protein
MRMILVIRMRSKGNLSSRCSTECLFAFRSLTHYVFNNNTNAPGGPPQGARFPFTNDMGRVRGRLTLMPGQSANADCRRAPGRHPRYSNVPLGGPFATPRTRRTSQVIERFSCIPTVQVGE